MAPPWRFRPGRARGRPKAVILGLHGYGDFAEGTFEGAAQAWARRGITTYAYDQRGFGANPSRLSWPGPTILVSDLLTVTAEIRRRHPGTRLIVLGHSMGGGTVLAAAAHGLDADALVLAAPAIAGGRETGLPARAAAYAVASIIPDRRFTGEGVVTIIPTDNREAPAPHRPRPAQLCRAVGPRASGTDPRHGPRRRRRAVRHPAHADPDRVEGPGAGPGRHRPGPCPHRRGRNA